MNKAKKEMLSLLMKNMKNSQCTREPLSLKKMLSVPSVITETMRMKTLLFSVEIVTFLCIKVAMVLTFYPMETGYVTTATFLASREGF